jgi:hypothetical protein
MWMVTLFNENGRHEYLASFTGSWNDAVEWANTEVLLHLDKRLSVQFVMV